jgi:hypothetical protein
MSVPVGRVQETGVWCEFQRVVVEKLYSQGQQGLTWDVSIGSYIASDGGDGFNRLGGEDGGQIFA